MPVRYFSVLKIVLSTGFVGFLLYLVFKNVEWKTFWEQTKSVDYIWVILSIAISFLGYVIRAYRWNILLQPLGYDLKTSRTTLAVLIGYLANLAVPRLGEITRCGVLKKNDKVSMPQAMGSVVTERIMDLCTLLILILISFFIGYGKFFSLLREVFANFQIPDIVLYLFIIVGIAGLVVLILIFKKWDTLKGKFAELVKKFLKGVFSFREIKNPVGFFISTLLLWTVYYFMSYIVVFSLPETSHLGFGAGFMLIVTGSIALTIPVQSGFGTYHVMVAGMLAVLYGIDQTSGIFMATLLHTSQIVGIVVFGTIALVVSFLIRRRFDEGDKNKIKPLIIK